MNQKIGLTALAILTYSPAHASTLQDYLAKTPGIEIMQTSSKCHQYEVLHAQTADGNKESYVRHSQTDSLLLALRFKWDELGYSGAEIVSKYPGVRVTTDKTTVFAYLEGMVLNYIVGEEKAMKLRLRCEDAPIKKDLPTQQAFLDKSL